jgi:uncharacterized membrane protein
MAMYIAIMYASQGFAHGQYQVRIATALYALSYILPFLVVPLAIANSLSNIPMGVFDIVGGFFVGLITGGAIYFVRRFKLPKLLVIPIIILGPGLIVPLWLSYLIGVPYGVLVINVAIGQITPAVVGYFLIKALDVHKKRIGIDE